MNAIHCLENLVVVAQVERGATTETISIDLGEFGESPLIDELNWLVRQGYGQDAFVPEWAVLPRSEEYKLVWFEYQVYCPEHGWMREEERTFVPIDVWNGGPDVVEEFLEEGWCGEGNLVRFGEVKDVVEEF